MPPDPYQTLGVKRSATHEEIRRAYRDLAKKHHPDLNPGNKAAEARFKLISAAHDILSDPEKRARFDRGEIDAAGDEVPPQPTYRDYAESDTARRYGQSTRQDPGMSEQDLHDIFGSIFDEPRRGGRASSLRGADLRYRLTVDFLDAINGARPRLSLPDGRTLDVQVPPGSADGQVLRLRGQGEPGWNGGASGDALIELHVSPHRYFERDGDDIRLVLPITLSEAVMGGTVEVPTPRGKVRMQIPPHSDTGTELRLRGRGVPAHGDRPAGNLYATLRIVLGEPDPALDAFIRTWKPAVPANPRRALEDL